MSYTETKNAIKLFRGVKGRSAKIFIIIIIINEMIKVA